MFIKILCVFLNWVVFVIDLQIFKNMFWIVDPHQIHNLQISSHIMGYLFTFLFLFFDSNFLTFTKPSLLLWAFGFTSEKPFPHPRSQRSTVMLSSSHFIVTAHRLDLGSTLSSFLCLVPGRGPNPLRCVTI